MNHLTLPRFWQSYNRLPKDIQLLADKKYELLKNNPFHPSLHFKKVGNRKQLWSVRINDNYRALGVEKTEGFGLVCIVSMMKFYIVRNGLKYTISRRSLVPALWSLGEALPFDAWGDMRE